MVIGREVIYKPQKVALPRCGSSIHDVVREVHRICGRVDFGGRANCCEVAAASGLDSWRSDGAAGMSGFVTVFSLACFRGRVVHRREHESV
jgi:hypothetical protein